MPTYIYALVSADRPVRLDGLTGVGDPPAELRTLRAGALTAVVSDAAEGLRAKRRDVLAHEAVVEAVMADGATLPMRFGLLGPDDDTVRQVLEADGDAYRARLAELDGHVEFHLRAARDEEDLLREIVTESEPVRELNARTRSGAAGHEDRVALGELVAREVARRHQEQAERTLERLRPLAARVSRGGADDGSGTDTSGGAGTGAGSGSGVASGTGAGAGHFLDVSFLVAEASAEKFVDAVREEADRAGTTCTFTLTGPLPPYSFV